METEDHAAPQSRSATLRKLRTKTRKTQPLTYISSTITKRKKSESQVSKAAKNALKKKKKNIVKKISNQIDFNNYKKIFCNTFSKFDSNNNINPFKSNFHGYYNHIKTSTEVKKNIILQEEEKNNDMINFFKAGKEYTNLKTLEKTQKVFDSAMDLLDKDPTFLDNFDVTKISNNVNDMKVKLDQCRKIVQKYNLNRELYTNNINQKDEGIEQQIFGKRIKMYEGLKLEANLSFDEIPYHPEFSLKEELHIENKTKNDLILNDDFIKNANEILDKNLKVEEDFVEKIKGSQLDYILKFRKKEDIDSFLKEHKMITGGINLDALELAEGEEKPLGWKIFKNLIVENHDGGMNTRKSLDIIGTKERFRTQKKNSDFLYYDASSMKKSVPVEPESKKSGRDKHGSQKKRTHDSGSQAGRSYHNHITHSADKMSVDEHSDSETQHSVLHRPIKMEFEDPKSLKLAESLIEDYREVLQHAFRNLSSRDPNFVRQAVTQDSDIEKKTGIKLNTLPQAQALDNLFQLDIKDLQPETYLLSIQTPPAQTSSVYTFASSFNTTMIPSYRPTVSNNIPTPPPLATGFFAVPVIVNSPQIISQPVALKAVDASRTVSNQILQSPVASFHPAPIKGKMVGDLVIPDLKPSPQLKSYKSTSQQYSQAQGNLPHSNFSLDSSTNLLNGEKSENKGLNISRNGSQGILIGNFAKKDSILDQLINSEDGSNINYYSIFNSMDQGADRTKGPAQYHLEGLNEKSIKKNNIILTQNSFQNA